MDLQKEGYSTNRILYSESPTEVIYFVPAYIRLKCKGFSGIDIKNNQGVINCTVKIDIFYGDLHQQIVEAIKNNLVMENNRGELIPLKEGISIISKQSKTQKSIIFEVRKYLKCRIDPDIFWTPYELLSMILTVNIHPVTGQTNGKRFTVRFNFMDHANNFQKIVYTEDCTFGQHSLAQALVRAQYSNCREPIQEQAQLFNKQVKKSKKEKQLYPNRDKQDKNMEKNNSLSIVIESNDQEIKVYQQMKILNSDQRQFQIKKLKNFEYAHFVMPLYKFPFVAILTIYIPLWFISAILLGNFFIGSIIVIGGRMTSLAMLLPLIRSLLATSPSLTFTQILIYIQSAVGSFMCLANILQINFNKYPKFPLDLVWQENAFFIISATVTLATVIIVVLQLLYHWIILQPSYKSKEKVPIYLEFKPWEWKNQKCDDYFKDKKLLTLSICQDPYQNKQIDHSGKLMNLYYQNKLLSYHED